ncbi:MAG: hypothetical protein AAGG55_04635 [Pseudomonadota bacterium]
MSIVMSFVMSTVMRTAEPLFLLLLPLLVLLSTSVVHAQPPRDASNGEIFLRENGEVLAYRDSSESWVPLEEFWVSYARNSEGRFWGKTADYPVYSKVAEHDTLLEVRDEGVCLMYFFHTRWRRAQDVRRWDPMQNEVLGCPHVFD